MRCCQITNRYFYDAFKYVTTIIGAATAAASKHLAATVDVGVKRQSVFFLKKGS